MQKRLNLATHYALRAKTPHPTLQNTPFTLSLFLLSYDEMCACAHISSSSSTLRATIPCHNVPIPSRFT